MSKQVLRITPQRLAIGGSILLSLWVWLGGSSINTDGVIYLNAARAFSESGLAAAIAVYNWAFYSVLIAGVSKFGLSLEAAAQLLNLLFFAALAQGFVAAVEKLHPKERPVHYLAALIVLLLPRFNILRSEIFRDNGYIACTMLSLVALLSFVRSGKQLMLAAWLLLTTLATLFRPEAAVLLTAGPAALFSMPRRSKSSQVAALLVLFGAAACLLLLAEHLLGNEHRSLLFWWHYYTHDFIEDFQRTAAPIENFVLSEFSNDYGKEGLLAVLSVVLVGITISTLTPIHALVLWLSRKYETGISMLDKRILWSYAIATTIPPIIFILKYHFMSPRYLLGLVVILLLLVPARVLCLIKKIQSPSARFAVIAILTLFFVITNIRQLTIETELKDAGVWLANQPGSVWTNNLPISYYARQTDRERSVEIQHNSAWETLLTQSKHFDWVAIVVRKKDALKIPEYINTIGGKEVRRFVGGGRFVIVVNTREKDVVAPLTP
jgi:hypothetical protein